MALLGRSVLVGGEVSIHTLARRDDRDPAPAAHVEQMLIARHDQRCPRRDRARKEFVVVRIGRHPLRERGRLDDRRGLRDQCQNRVQWGRERRVARREDGAGLVVLGEDGRREHQREPLVLPRRQQPTGDAAEEDPGEEHVGVQDGVQRRWARHRSDHAR